MPERPHVVVVGGGISGLAAAYALRRSAGDSVRVTVLEQAASVGGKLAVGSLGGVEVDLGAESMLMRRPEAVRLAERVGLGNDLVHPAASGALLWTRGRLRRMPSGLVMGIPTDLRDLAASEVLSLLGLARIPLDLVLPGGPVSGDRAIGPFVAHRLGREVVDRLVEPLLGGVYAGHADRLSLDAVLPQVSGAVRVERSLLRCAERTTGPSPAGAAVFAGLRGGVGQLPGAVAEASGAEIRTRRSVRALERTEHGWRVVTGATRSPVTIEADAVVLAVPAAPAARLLGDVAPVAAGELREVPYASVALATFVVPKRSVPALPPGTGFLVPPVDGRLAKAATFESQKWGWVAEQRRDVHVIRVSVGRFEEEATLQMDDADLAAAAFDDLVAALGWPDTARPAAQLVTRWGGALPQYLVGHLDRVARIRTALTEVPGVAVCGAAYDGVGIPACVAGGEAAAAQVLRRLRTRPQWAHEHVAEPGAVLDGA
jgi:oxygen-dependent protoporphyrinogen oxidase